MLARNILKELSQLDKSPIDGIWASLSDEDSIDRLTAWIQGPVDTPYFGGFFRVDLTFGCDYPRVPPKCRFTALEEADISDVTIGRFVTKIFHPNVNEQGDICVNTLKKDWSQAFGIAHILTTIRCLLIYPNPESALHEEAGRLLLENYQDYAKHASLLTDIHAGHCPPHVRHAVEPRSPASTSQNAMPLHPITSTLTAQASNINSPLDPVNKKRSAQGSEVAPLKRRGLKRL